MRPDHCMENWHPPIHQFVFKSIRIDLPHEVLAANMSSRHREKTVDPFSFTRCLPTVQIKSVHQSNRGQASSKCLLEARKINSLTGQDNENWCILT